MLTDVLQKWGAFEVKPMEAYRDIFHLDEDLYIQKNREDFRQRANPLVYYQVSGKGHYRIMFADDFEEVLHEAQEADFAIINGLSYWGRKNTQQYASKMFAMIFDLDGVTDTTLNNFCSGAIDGHAYPLPNYVALSGHGCHLYYVFEEPLSLYPNTKMQLKELKYALTRRIWNPYTSKEKVPQFQGINQGFRVLGGRTKIDGVRVRVFRMNQHPITITKLNEFVPDESAMDEQVLWKESKYTLAEAKKKFPEWYETVIERKERKKKKWDIAGKVHGNDPYALYHWWQRKALAGAVYHHRYFAAMMLVIYGVKCGVPEEQVRKDAMALIPDFTAIKPEDPFTETDVKAAMECYDDRYATFPIKDIAKLSSIEVKKNKRNGRKQAVHMGVMRAIQGVLDPDGKWRNKDGRPPGSGKQLIVMEWRQVHPDGRKIDCQRETGLSRPTILKWWDYDLETMKQELKAKDPYLYDLIEQYGEGHIKLWNR